MPLQRAVYAPSVTATATPQNLLALIVAKGGIYTTLQGSCRSWNISMDLAASGDVYVGDENVSTSNCGFHLQSGGSFLDRASMPGMGPIGAIFVVTATSTAVLNVFVFPE